MSAREKYDPGTRELEDEIKQIEQGSFQLHQAGLKIRDAEAVASIVNPRLNEILRAMWEELEESVQLRRIGEGAVKAAAASLSRSLVAASRLKIT